MRIDEWYFPSDEPRSLVMADFGPSDYGSAAFRWKMCYDEGAHGGCPDLRELFRPEFGYKNPYTGLPYVWEDPDEVRFARVELIINQLITHCYT